MADPGRSWTDLLWQGGAALGVPAVVREIYHYFNGNFTGVWTIFTLCFFVLWLLHFKSNIFESVARFKALYKDLDKLAVTTPGDDSVDPFKERLKKLIAARRQASNMRFNLAGLQQGLERWPGKSWSASSFERLLNFSFIYPLFILFVVWVFTNQGNLGQTLILPPVGQQNMAGLLIRLALLIVITLPSLLIVYWTRLTQWFKRATPLPPFVIQLGLGMMFIAAVAVAVAVAVAGAFTICQMLITERWPGWHDALFNQLGLIGLVIASIFLTPHLFSLPASHQQAGAIAYSFIILFYLAVLPVINAIFDWLSLNITRHFISRYLQNRQAHLWVYMLADIIVAPLLVGALFASVLATLALFQYAGWPVNAAVTARQFIAHPFNGHSQWLVLMAITNLLPTVVHLAMAGYTLARTHSFVQPAQYINSILKKLEPLLHPPAPASRILLPDTPTRPAITGVSLNEREKLALCNFVYLDHWFALISVILALGWAGLLLWPLVMRGLSWVAVHFV